MATAKEKKAAETNTAYCSSEERARNGIFWMLAVTNDATAKKGSRKGLVLKLFAIAFLSSAEWTRKRRASSVAAVNTVRSPPPIMAGRLSILS